MQSYEDRLIELDVVLETSSEAAELHEVIDEATPVVRVGRHVLEVLSALRKALPDDDAILAVRDRAVSMERRGDLLLSDAKSSLDFLIALSAAILGMNDPAEMLSLNALWVVVVGGRAPWLGGAFGAEVL